MKDNNNVDLMIGDIVEISGAYFKNQNGYYFIESDRGNALTLRKIGKTGKLLKSGNTVEFFPLTSFCSDPVKNREAKKHNSEFARIEKTEKVPFCGVAEYFRDQITKTEKYIEREEMYNNHGDLDSRKEELKQLQAVYSRFADVDIPEEKKPEKGIKFYYNGIKVDGGQLKKCNYYYDSKTKNVIIYADGYGSTLPREYFCVKNNTDFYTDYFEKDRATLTPDHPLYKFALYAAYKEAARFKHSTNQIPEQENPGQPTAADLAAVAEMNTAAENARCEAERQAEIEEREKYLRERAEGRRYIEQMQEQHPIRDGEPVVVIPYSEYPGFYSWTEAKTHTKFICTVNDDGTRTTRKEEQKPEPLTLSISAADEIFKHFDSLVFSESGYYKTDFIIKYTDENGDPATYEGRYDIGDQDGGIVEHVKSFGEYKNDENIIKTAEYLRRYTVAGCVVSVTFAPWAADYIKRRKEAQQERAKNEADDVKAKLQILTDEQLKMAVYLIPNDGKDKNKENCARIFLQELMNRDEKSALQVFKNWKEGNIPDDCKF